MIIPRRFALAAFVAICLSKSSTAVFPWLSRKHVGAPPPSTSHRLPEIETLSVRQLTNALEHLRDEPSSTLFLPESDSDAAIFGKDAIYLKDRYDDVWFVRGGASFASGRYGLVRDAWNLTRLVELATENRMSTTAPLGKLRKSKWWNEEKSLSRVSQLLEIVPPVVFKKIHDVGHSEAGSHLPFDNEFKMLQILGRSVGKGVTVFSNEETTIAHRYGSTCDLDKPFIDMIDRCPEGTFAVFMQTKMPGVPFPDDEKFHVRPLYDRLLKKIMAKVKELHTFGWRHGDVRPENVLIEETIDASGHPSYEIHLVDFGYARPLTDTDIQRDFKDVQNKFRMRLDRTLRMRKEGLVGGE